MKYRLVQDNIASAKIGREWFRLEELDGERWRLVDSGYEDMVRAVMTRLQGILGKEPLTVIEEFEVGSDG